MPFSRFGAYREFGPLFQAQHQQQRGEGNQERERDRRRSVERGVKGRSAGGRPFWLGLSLQCCQVVDDILSGLFF